MPKHPTPAELTARLANLREEGPLAEAQRALNRAVERFEDTHRELGEIQDRIHAATTAAAEDVLSGSKGKGSEDLAALGLEVPQLNVHCHRRLHCLEEMYRESTVHGPVDIGESFSGLLEGALPALPGQLDSS